MGLELVVLWLSRKGPFPEESSKVCAQGVWASAGGMEAGVAWRDGEPGQRRDTDSVMVVLSERQLLIRLSVCPQGQQP